MWAVRGDSPMNRRLPPCPGPAAESCASPSLPTDKNIRPRGAQPLRHGKERLTLPGRGAEGDWRRAKSPGSAHPAGPRRKGTAQPIRSGAHSAQPRQPVRSRSPAAPQRCPSGNLFCSTAPALEGGAAARTAGLHRHLLAAGGRAGGQPARSGPTAKAKRRAGRGRVRQHRAAPR